MKKIERKIFISPNLNIELKDRLSHIDNGIANDNLIPEGFKFDIKYNRDVVKKVIRFSDFLKSAESSEIEKYFKEREEIKDLSNIYKGLKSYTPLNSYFKLIFLESKSLLKDNEYYLLYLEPKDLNNRYDDIKDLLSKSIEYKKEYVETDTQKRISNYKGYNIVLGAAGTGKTLVAINSYINSSIVDNLKDLSIRDDVFITYSKKLADYVSYFIDIFWNDYKNPLKKNVFTTKDFFINLLKEINFNLDGYKLENNNYIKLDSKLKLEDNIADFNTFNNWINNSFLNMNKANIPSLEAIINKYGSDYPYLFFRGIYKGKIINKVSDEEIANYFTLKHDLINLEFESIKTLLNDYFEFDGDESLDSFESWYNLAIKRYQSTFKNIPSRFKNVENLYSLYLEYIDFANPIRINKRYIDYYELFKREVLLIEGYRGETRKDFEEEIDVLYKMSDAYQKYLSSNFLYDDNDLAYFVALNIDKILDKGIFKNIIVDEFQDMTERQIDLIVKLTNSDSNSGVSHIFGDFEQTINPTFLQMENVETLYLINDIKEYEKQILSSSFRYSQAICKELEALRLKGKELFGTEDKSVYLPLVSNSNKEFETGGNLLLDIEKGNEIIKDIAKAKLQNVMYIVSSIESKLELINNFKVDKDKVFTIQESKGMEEDFVIVYKICSDKAQEYENLFSKDNSYSRAGRIFYNQLYVGITRCKTNFLEIEDINKLGPNTINTLNELIEPLLLENISLFKEELLSNKANFYFRALDSFKNLDFDSALENLAFYSGLDHDDLRYALNLINKYINGIDKKDEIIKLANIYKDKRRFDLARVLYIVLDNTNMQYLIDLRMGNKVLDDTIKDIIKNEFEFLSDSDIDSIKNSGYFNRKEEYLINKIKNIKR